MERDIKIESCIHTRYNKNKIQFLQQIIHYVPFLGSDVRNYAMKIF